MKTTISIDDALYRRLKVEAARRGQTVRDLVTEGITHVLETPPARAATDVQGPAEAWQPEWFASLARYGRAVDDHAIEAVRAARVRRTRRQSV
jgi:predicted transcriptional regulator